MDEYAELDTTLEDEKEDERDVEVVVVNVGVGICVVVVGGTYVEVVAAGAAPKYHEPVRTPADSDAKYSNSPREKSRPP